MDDLLEILVACKYLSWSLLVGWSSANQGISLVDLIHLGAYELVELDKYAYVACDKMIEWYEWLIIKFELVWMDKFIRWHLVSGLNEYMSCESIQTSWV